MRNSYSCVVRWVRAVRAELPGRGCMRSRALIQAQAHDLGFTVLGIGCSQHTAQGPVKLHQWAQGRASADGRSILSAPCASILNDETNRPPPIMSGQVKLVSKQAGVW